MSLEKLGNFFCVPENNTSSGISGNGVTEPIGLDSNVYPEYNETCLFSSIYSCQTGNLSDSFAKYQRLRLRVGWHNNSTTTNEGDAYLEVTPAPSAGSNVAAIWNVGTGSPGYICVGRINFPTLSSFNGTYGKLCDMNGNTGNTGWEGKLRPIKEIWGINKVHPYYLFCIPSEGGTVTGVPISGYAGDASTITVIPESDEWRQSALNITGAELTGNDFMFANSNVSAQAEFEHSRDLTLVNGDHGVLSADAMSGFSGDIITVDATTDEGWYLSAIAVTGAEATGFKFMFTGSDVTAQGEYTDVGFPVTYLADDGVHCTGDVSIYIPGSEGIPLTTSYDTYYRISGYDVDNGSVENGVLYPTGPCTVRAVAKLNTFTASGGWEKGSNVTAYRTTTNVPQKYATASYKTDNVPTSWYATSNRWNPNGASAYQITLNPKMKFSAGNGSTVNDNAGATGVTLIGSTQTQSQTFSIYVGKQGGTGTASYNKTITSDVQGVTYGISGRVSYPGGNHYGTAAYIATGTTGTWTATGIAP